MIKLVCFFRRKVGMSREDFHSHWLSNHGALIRDTPELARHIVRYEQNHRLASDYDRDAPDAPGFDGSTIQWLDSMESFYGFVREPKYRELIAPDEERFIDRESIALLFTEVEDVKIGGSGPSVEKATLKLLALLSRKPGISASEFHRHWAGQHARLFAEPPEVSRHILAYHQNHRLEKDYERDGGGGIDGLAEQWYASAEEFNALLREPAYLENVPADEEHFIDRPAIQFLLSGPADVIIG